MKIQEKLSDCLFDAIDIRKALSTHQHGKSILNLLKDSDGTDTTVGDCLDNIIETLEELEQHPIGVLEKRMDDIKVKERLWKLIGGDKWGDHRMTLKFAQKQGMTGRHLCNRITGRGLLRFVKHCPEEAREFLKAHS